MKILQLANHCDRSGNGIVNVAVDLSCYLASSGHAVVFASAGGEYESLLAERGVKHVDVDQRRRRPQQLIRAVSRLFRVCRHFRPDIVHAHMITGALIARVLRPFFNYKIVTTVHNEFEKTAVLMTVGDRVIAVSDAVQTALVARGISAQKIVVVKNGSAESPRLVGEPPVVALDHPAIVTVAGMNHRKGIADLIEAFDIVVQRSNDASLYLVGNGSEFSLFRDMADRLASHERIHFMGFVADPRGFLREADVFILASHSEPFGLVLTEAREASCAIVATDVGGIPEALDAGEAGILVPAARPDLMANAIEDLLNNPQKARDLARRASQGLDRFTVSRFGKETEEVYTALRTCLT
jgi:glycosyltransferase involved in cell wall biosynthesis